MIVLYIFLALFFVVLLRKPFIDLVFWFWFNQLRLRNERNAKIDQYTARVQLAYSLGLIDYKEKNCMLMVYEVRSPVNMVPYYESVLNELLFNYGKKNV